jgi:hypothetical protein
MASNASLNVIGANVRRSVLRVLVFFFDRFFTYSLSAPSGLPISLAKKSKLAGQPVPSNALFVCEPFPGSLFNCNFHPLTVCDFSIVPTECKFIRIFGKMFSAHVMKGTHNATLEKRKETFASIHVRDRAISVLAGILVNRVIYNMVLFELLVQADVNASLIRIDYGILGALGKAGSEVALGNIGDHLCPNWPVALNECDDRSLYEVLGFVCSFSADKGLVDFNGALEQFGERALSHSKANAVSHKPSRLVCNVQHTVQLMGTHSLFGRAKKKDRHKPFADGNVRVLKDCSNRHRKLLPASPALIKPLTSGPLAVRLRHKCVNALDLSVIRTMGASRTIGPAERFKQLSRFVIVGILLSKLNKVQFLGVKNGLRFIHTPNLHSGAGFVNYIIPNRSSTAFVRSAVAPFGSAKVSPFGKRTNSVCFTGCGTTFVPISRSRISHFGLLNPSR